MISAYHSYYCGKAICGVKIPLHEGNSFSFSKGNMPMIDRTDLEKKEGNNTMRNKNCCCLKVRELLQKSARPSVIESGKEKKLARIGIL